MPHFCDGLAGEQDAPALPDGLGRQHGGAPAGVRYDKVNPSNRPKFTTALNAALLYQPLMYDTTESTIRIGSNQFAIRTSSLGKLADTHAALNRAAS